MHVSTYDYGPLRTYEITWKSGHVETVQGHQITLDSWRAGMRSPYGDTIVTSTADRFSVHGMFGEHWRLMLTAPEADLLYIRDVTDRESIPGTP